MLDCLVKTNDVLSASRLDFYLLPGPFVNTPSTPLMSSLSQLLSPDPWRWQASLWESTRWVSKQLLFPFTSCRSQQDCEELSKDTKIPQKYFLSETSSCILAPFQSGNPVFLSYFILCFFKPTVNITDASSKEKMIRFILDGFSRCRSQCSRIRF